MGRNILKSCKSVWNYFNNLPPLFSLDLHNSGRTFLTTENELITSQKGIETATPVKHLTGANPTKRTWRIRKKMPMRGPVY